MKYSVLLFCSILPTILLADIVVFPVVGDKLPYALSPSNYDLSPSNYDNAVSNYDNSPSNYDNLPSNYDNSAANSKNSVTGNRSILVEEKTKFIHYGYMVVNKEGVTNFYSTGGVRLFYNPKKGSGIYHGASGAFCGVLASVDGKTRLALTEVGMKYLLLQQ